jgi:superfamily II RNA helicase
MDIEEFKKSLKFELDDFQVEAIKHIDNGHNVIICCPTGAGKTLVAEYAINYSLNKYSDAQIYYTCPIKALCNEKLYEFSSQKQNKITYGLATGDFCINRDAADVVVCTTEILCNLLINKNNEKEENKDNKKEENKDNEKEENKDDKKNKIETIKKQKKISCIIFDEAHYLNDTGRGHVWEKSMILGSLDKDCLLILLSATIGNVDSVVEWLDKVNDEKKCKKIMKYDRPVPLREWFLSFEKCRNFKKGQRKTKEQIIETKKNNREDIIQNIDEPITLTNDPNPDQYELMPVNNLSYDKIKKYWSKLEEKDYSVKYEVQTMCNVIVSDVNLGIPAIIFVFSKKKCIEYAEFVEQSYVTHEERKEILDFYDENLREFKDNNSQYTELRKTISKGIAYHNSSLIPKIRECIEFLIKKKLIKFVFATETFAMGLNFPVKTVLLTAINKPCEDGFRNFLVSEYKQMAGRAGRRFQDKYGNIILWIMGTRKHPSFSELNNIMNGPVDRIVSKYVIEPIFILKNIDDQIHKLISSKSFAYYKSHRNEIKELTIPTKLKKIFDLKFQMIALEENGLKCNMKAFTKLHKALSDDDKKEYEDLMKLFEDNKKKTDLDHYDDFENSIYEFLLNHDFIEYNKEDIHKYVLTEKGQMADQFSEINPIIFVNDMNFILKEDVLETLSMFIDDGLKESEDSVGYYENATINYFIEKTEMLYSEYIKKYPKWNFYPVNFVFLQYWLSDENISLDQASKQFGYDQGAIVKVLVKMYQICDELITNLTRINRTDMVEYINERKQLLIRYPLKLESLYVNY